MASPRNVAQIFAANPVTAIANTDLLYVSAGGTTDAAISGLSLKVFMLPTTTTANLIPLSANGAQAGWSTYTMPATVPANSMLISGTTANQVSALAIGTTGRFPMNAGAGVQMSIYALPIVLSAGGIFYAANSTSVAQLPTVNFGMYVSNSAGTPQVVAPLNGNTPAGTPVVLVNNTPTDVKVIPSVPAGKWLLLGNLSYIANTGTCSYAQGWVSATSATVPADVGNLTQTTSIAAANNNGFTVIGEVTLATAGSLYLSTIAGFTAGLSVCGNLFLIPI